MKNEGHKWLWGRIIIIIRSFFIELRGRFWRLKGGAKCQSLKSQMKSWYNCGGCYTVEKSFPIVPIGYLAIDLGIKWETEATEKKVRSLDFCCIIILMDNLAYLATNFYERDEHKPIEKFCTLCALEDESHCFFSLRRSLVFYSKALQFLFLGFLLHHNLLQIAWLSFCLSKQHWQSQMELESLTF